MRKQQNNTPTFKIAYLCHYYPWITQTFVFREIEELKNRGVPLKVVAFKMPDEQNIDLLTPEMQTAIKQTYYLPAPWKAKNLYSQLETLIRHPKRYLRSFWQVFTGSYLRFSSFKLRLHAIQDFLRGVHLSSFLQRNGFTHVHAEFPNHSATSAWVAHKLSGIPFSFRSYTSYNPQIIQHKIADAKFVLCCSEYDKKQLLSYCSQCYADKLFVDVLGIDVDSWHPDETIDETPDLILCVASLGEKKGQEYLIRACHLLKVQGVSFQTLFVGGGADRQKLSDLIESLKLQDHVKISNYIPHSKVRELMQQAAVFCLPCVKSMDGDTDGIPFVLMEAMALYKACISTRISGVPELIEHRLNGLLVKDRDPEALASALKEILCNVALRKQLGIAARERILSKFNIRQNTAKTSELFLKQQN